MWPFDYFKKKREKAEQERLRMEREQERAEHVRLQKLEDERIEKERQKWLEENHRKATERNAKLRALRDHLKEVTADIDAENEAKAEEQRRKMIEEEERVVAERNKRIEEQRKKKEHEIRQKQKAEQKVNNMGIKTEVDNIIATFETGNIALLQQKLYELYSKFNKPGGGKLVTSFPEKDRLCEVFNLCLQYDWINDPDIREVWSENAFYCISEYFKVANSKQDYFAAALDLFITCAYGKISLKTKFDDILNKARLHPIHNSIFAQSEYEQGSDYLIREFAFFSATLISPMVKMHPDIISPNLQRDYELAKTDFEFATISPEDIMKKMHLISAIIGSVLDSM